MENVKAKRKENKGKINLRKKRTKEGIMEGIRKGRKDGAVT
jgi:hypothetical protein